jgi:glycosyltransferase involved in cell wall biosynthesis
VGGFESIPAQLLPWKYPAELAEELIRNAANIVSEKIGTLGKKGGAATLTIASTEETAAAFARSGVSCKLLPTIGVSIADFPEQGVVQEKQLRLLFAGRLLYWKGVELAICALHAAGGDTQLTFAGEGRFRGNAERLVSALGLQGKVHFLGQVPRTRLLSLYRNYDAMLFPSLHDTGGGALLEGMANGLPVICLHCGGPALAVSDDCGIRVPLGSRKEVVAALAAAIRRYASEPDLRSTHGRQARKRIAEKYDMDRKGEVMNALYDEAMAL